MECAFKLDLVYDFTMQTKRIKAATLGRNDLTTSMVRLTEMQTNLEIFNNSPVSSFRSTMVRRRTKETRKQNWSPMRNPVYLDEVILHRMNANWKPSRSCACIQPATAICDLKRIALNDEPQRKVFFFLVKIQQ